MPPTLISSFKTRPSSRWRSSTVLYNFLELYHLSEAMSIDEAMPFYKAMPFYDAISFYEAISALLPAVYMGCKAIFVLLPAV